MVKKSVLGILIVMFAMVASSAFAAVPAPLGSWSFETTGPGVDQTPDSQGVHPGNLLPGSGLPVLGPIGAPGFGNAAQLDALGEHVVAPDPVGGLSIGNGDGTIALWVRHDGQSFGNDGSNGREAIYMEKLGGPAGYTLYSRDNEGGGTNGTPHLYMQAAGEKTWDAVYSGVTLNDGAWHHMAITKRANPGINADELILYIDGVAIQAAGLAGGETVHTIGINSVFDEAGSDVYMGKRNPAIWGQEHQLNGAIDEVAIFNVALSADQVRELMIPEPMTMSLLSLGGLALLRRKRS